MQRRKSKYHVLLKKILSQTLTNQTSHFSPGSPYRYEIQKVRVRSVSDEDDSVIETEVCVALRFVWTGGT
jgi:hypothetical protein